MPGIKHGPHSHQHTETLPLGAKTEVTGHSAHDKSVGAPNVFRLLIRKGRREIGTEPLVRCLSTGHVNPAGVGYEKASTSMPMLLRGDLKPLHAQEAFLSPSTSGGHSRKKYVRSSSRQKAASSLHSDPFAAERAQVKTHLVTNLVPDSVEKQKLAQDKPVMQRSITSPLRVRTPWNVEAVEGGGAAVPPPEAGKSPGPSGRRVYKHISGSSTGAACAMKHVAGGAPQPPRPYTTRCPAKNYEKHNATSDVLQSAFCFQSKEFVRRPRSGVPSSPQQMRRASLTEHGLSGYMTRPADKSITSPRSMDLAPLSDSLNRSQGISTTTISLTYAPEREVVPSGVHTGRRSSGYAMPLKIQALLTGDQELKATKDAPPSDKATPRVSRRVGIQKRADSMGQLLSQP